MPPKRRKVASAGTKVSDGETTVKKSKPTSAAAAAADCKQLDDKTHQWHYEEKPGTWIMFDDDTQKELTKAYNDKEEELEIDDGEFVIMLTKPCRKTKKTGYQKRVRVAVIDKDNQAMTWSWEDSKRKKRHYYSVQSVLDLDDNLDSDSLDVFSEGKQYTVDVRSMKHSETLKMYREVADARPAPAPAPKAPVDSTSKGKSAAAKAASELKKKQAKSEPEIVQERTVVVKGKAPVDSECPLAGTSHVYYDTTSGVWDCMLNQTNLQNNNNKYYVIQLLEDDSSKRYNVWMRWGRVGKKGQTATMPCGANLEEAMKIFRNKFRDKTKNQWEDRKTFIKVVGKYDLLEMDYSADTKDEVDAVAKPKDSVKVPDSKLDTRLQELINLICDLRAMEEAVVEMKYDAKKAPLGKLTKSQIQNGYSALKEIETLVRAGDFGFKLTEACNKFYTRIPHDFGMKTPPRITSLEILQSKITLLEALGDIEIAVNVLKAGDMSINPIDRHYMSLECELKPMNKADKMYKTLEEYLLWTHADTHNSYSLQLLDIFQCDKDQDYKPHMGNKMLLWHGSRLTNWVGILAKGLRIAPPEAPVTGYMFGKGVYFADCSSKSANYCFATKQKDVGLLMLNEVAIGQPNELLASDYNANKLPSGTHSTKGCGQKGPDPGSHVVMDGVTIPRGKLKDTGVKNPSGYTLLYNEYIVYNTSQIKMKYLLKVKFNYKY